MRLDPSLQRIKADPVQMEQIIFNLAVNARDAMPDGGKLTLATCNIEISPARAHDRRGVPPGNYIALAVTDTGIGMDAPTQARIFEPFFTTKDPGKGTGLGLATVYGVVQQTGGWILVSSELGRGTTFEIYFPRVEEKLEPLPVNIPATVPSTTRGSETILLVEDQEGIRDMTAEFLGRNGYQVLNAEDGSKALEIVAGHSGTIHLVITDMSMPNMGGRELASRLTHLRPQTQILFMSGHPDHTSPGNDTVPFGAPVLQKPFALDDLAQRVRDLLDANQS
jgi:two-component system, cell cycle sensor histidine kinase and response regulator CckA